MKITREADYALRIISMLSVESHQVEAKIISEKKHIPYRFTLKILRKLVQAEMVKSYRGVNGGYALKKNSNEISLKDVIEVIDGPIAINRCISEPEICINTGDCKIQKELLKAQKIFANYLSDVSFQDITEGD